MTLPERIVLLHKALNRRRIPHAFGGAIALAYATLDPRGTSDIDLNLFVPAERAARVLAALPADVQQPDGTLDKIERDGQVRLWWNETPLDLFFDYAPIHAEAARHRKVVPFAETRIPILAPGELAVFKAMFDRTRDWADIEAMAAAGTLDFDAVRTALEPMLGPRDPRLKRLERTRRTATQGR